MWFVKVDEFTLAMASINPTNGVCFNNETAWLEYCPLAMPATCLMILMPVLCSKLYYIFQHNRHSYIAKPLCSRVAIGRCLFSMTINSWAVISCKYTYNVAIATAFVFS